MSEKECVAAAGGGAVGAAVTVAVLLSFLCWSVHGTVRAPTDFQQAPCPNEGRPSRCVFLLFISLRDRLRSKGTLNDVTLACSDTCCDGLKNPTEHVMMKLFPGLKKWPIADAFHKVQIGTDSMVAGHEYYADAARYVSRLSLPLNRIVFVASLHTGVPSPRRPPSFCFFCPIVLN